MEKIKGWNYNTEDFIDEIETTDLSVYLEDQMYLPIQYKGIVIEQPPYLGDGRYSMYQLEKICNQFKEYCHQQNIIKNNVMKHLAELK